MQVRINICRKLPEELQIKIWKDYVNRHLTEEIENFTNPIYLYLDLYEKSYENVKSFVKRCVNNMYMLYVNNPFYLAVLLDMLEERVFDAIHYYKNSELLDIIQIVRQFISMPSLLVIEILHGPDFTKSIKMNKLASIKENMEIVFRMMFPYEIEE